ncbi:unnamed protein product [Rhizophagus irregularis]|nr:unnamed protein product [Rhizophagus irregularis]
MAQTAGQLLGQAVPVCQWIPQNTLNTTSTIPAYPQLLDSYSSNDDDDDDDSSYYDPDDYDDPDYDPDDDSDGSDDDGDDYAGLGKRKRTSKRSSKPIASSSKGITTVDKMPRS